MPLSLRHDSRHRIVWPVSTLLLLTILLTAGAACTPQRESVKPGINDRYFDPELNVDEWVGRFEGESREVFACRSEIMARVQLRSDHVVADVGAGTGLFTPFLADKTKNGGKVIAVDIIPKFLDHIRTKADERGLRNVETHLCSETSIELPRNSVDAIFTSDTYHHFEYPHDTLKSMYHALRKGGTLYVLDFERIEGTSREWILGHVRAGKETVIDEIKAAGFRYEGEMTPDCLEENYMIRFTKR
ncbi:MAG: class I SAM-dependent methyltransferase [Phycisphaerae bacterium]